MCHPYPGDEPVLVDHVRDPEAVVDDLAPSVAVEILAAELAGAQVPGSAVSVRPVPEERRRLLPVPQAFPQPEQMPVHTSALDGIVEILHMRPDGVPKSADPFVGPTRGIGHGIAKRHALDADAAAGLRTALLEATGGCGFVGGAVLAVHFMVGQLDDHLNVSVRGTLEFFDETFAVGLVGLNRQFVLTEKGLEIGNGATDVARNVSVDVKGERNGFRKIGANGRVVKVESVGKDKHVRVVVQSMRRGAVHHAVFPHETGGAVVIDDELQRFVEPTVAAVPVPVLVGSLFQGHRGGIIKTHDERRSLDGFGRRRVSRVSGEECRASRCPNITVLRRESANGRRDLGPFINVTKLLLEFGSVELLTAHVVHHLEKLVLSHDNDVLVVLMMVFDREIRRTSRNTTGVEHPLI